MVAEDPLEVCDERLEDLDRVLRAGGGLVGVGEVAAAAERVGVLAAEDPLQASAAAVLYTGELVLGFNSALQVNSIAVFSPVLTPGVLVLVDLSVIPSNILTGKASIFVTSGNVVQCSDLTASRPGFGVGGSLGRLAYCF